jgi:hypothetical protein
MDEFYSEMQDLREDLSPNNPESISQSQDLGFLQSHFPNMFAEALVQINPRRWPTFTAGSTMASEMPQFLDKIQTPMDNLVVAKEYFKTSQSDLQWRARFWQVCEDTVWLNFASELGSFSAGAASNKIAAGYIDEMVATCVYPNSREELNARIFKIEAQELNLDPENVRGTGLAREFVPIDMEGDLCDRPERNARQKPFADNDGGLFETGIIINPNQGGPSNTNGDLNSPIDSNFESSNYPTEIDSKTNNNGSIFGRFFGFGGGSDMCYDPTSASSTLSMDLDLGCDPTQAKE